MKINKWTLGLAAVGLVSLASVARAEEAKTVPLLTALSATTISGYVDVSAVWNPGTGNANPAPYSFNGGTLGVGGKQDGFNVNAISLTLAKPLEEGQWSSGYKVDLLYGPDAAAVNSGGGVLGNGLNGPIRQAYVQLRAPVGNGLDFKIGQFDNILGYESSDGYKNPNFTRSYGYTIEPTEHTGILAEYKVNDAISLTGGVANNVTTAFSNARNLSGTTGTAPGRYTIESKKAILAMVSLTAPESWGWIGGSSLYGAVDYGPGFGANNNNGIPSDKTQWYLGATLKTPLKALTVGFAYDIVQNLETGGIPVGGLGPLSGAGTGYATTIAGYASWKITDKASLHGRVEYGHGTGFSGVFAQAAGTSGFNDNKILALTGTFQYDLWQNVISRLEIRWDHSADGTAHFGGTTIGSAPSKKNDLMLAANFVYKF